MTKRLDGPAIGRRHFLKGAAGTVATLATGCGPASSPPPSDGWRAGEVAHLLPTADHQRIRLKASFHEAQQSAPRLRVGELRVPGQATSSSGRFFTFDVAGLTPATEYVLQLERPGGEPICDAWPLRTFPAPDAEPERFRLLAYTCAGGPEDPPTFGLFNAFLPIADRQRMFARALSFRPDAVVANGDHVYWDMQSRMGWAMGRSPVAWWRAGWFDRERPIVGTPNEQTLMRGFGPQIADLYGVRFRSVPTFFLQDDHDYGENDEASDALRTFPPDPFMLDLARVTQQLYYPELLATPGLPAGHVRADGVAESFGALRYGRLFEALLYDCRRHLSNATDPLLDQPHSSFVPADVERWLIARTQQSRCAHLAHMPSTPILWSAGKWGEWYPDYQDEAGSLRDDIPKPYWAEGWAAQHDRLLDATASRGDRTPLFVSGDLHATAMGRIHASNGRSLEGNPVVSVLSGSVGTGELGWPSRFRGQLPKPSGSIDAEELLPPLERNGFSLLDFTPDSLTLSFFGWRPEQGSDALDRLEPFEVVELPRPRRGSAGALS
jgi:phosphodiesterase/alkaline phosphatase D-like protein